MKSLCLAFCFLIHAAFVLASAEPAQVEKGKPLKIALLLWRGETQAEKGLKDGLEQLGYKVEYTTYSVDQDKERLADILRNEIEPKLGAFDYIYCFGTTTIKMAKRMLGDEAPLLFDAVSFPVNAEIANSMDAPGGNLSGVTNTVPIEKQVERARELVLFKKLGVIFNTRERNAVLWAQEMNAISRKLNFDVVELDVSPRNNTLEQALEDLTKKRIEIDAVFLPNDSFLISQAKLIAQTLCAGKIPVIGAHEDFVKNGALIGFVTDYYELGKLAAAIVDRNRKGEKLGQIPIGVSKNPKLLVNKKTCNLLGIQLPKEMAENASIIE